LGVWAAEYQAGSTLYIDDVLVEVQDESQVNMNLAQTVPPDMLSGGTLGPTRFEIGKVAGFFDIEQIVLRKDVTSFNWFTIFPSPIWSRNDPHGMMPFMEQRLQTDSSLEPIWKNGNVTIFLNKKNLPHIFASARIGIVGGGLNVLRWLAASNSTTYADSLLVFATQVHNASIAERAELVLFENRGALLDLLGPYLDRAIDLEPGMYAGQDMDKEWSDMHNWYWVYDNYQERLERVAATSGANSSLSVPFQITRRDRYVLVIEPYFSKIGSNLVLAVRDSRGELVGAGAVNTRSENQTGFQWVLIPREGASESLLSIQSLQSAVEASWSLGTGKYTLDITSCSGENALAMIRLVPVEEFISAAQRVASFVQKATTVYVGQARADKQLLPAGRTPRVQYTRINPTRYIVSITQAETPFYLAFLETYDPGWIASITGPNEPDLEHFEALGYANAWLVPKTGNFEILLEFEPQKMYQASLYVSLFAYITIGVTVGCSEVARHYRFRFCLARCVRKWIYPKKRSVFLP
jgi:hypothetical protein